MLKFIFLLLVFSSTSFARTLILHKNVKSGFVRPQDSFMKDCKVYQEGYAVIRKKFGYYPTRITRRSVSFRRVLLINTLLNIAKNGHIDNRGAVCDAGDKLLYGYYRGDRFILDENKDCVGHKVNESPVTPFLKTHARQVCGF